MARRATWALWVTVGCASAPPEAALQRYRAAIARADTAAVADLEAQPARSAAELDALRSAYPGAWTAAREQLAGAVVDVRLEAVMRLTSGATVTAVREGGEWRIRGEVWSLVGAETPEAALATLAAGIAAGNLAAVRQVLPEAHQARFATDLALQRHLERIRDRVAAALRRIGPLRPGLAVIEGARARLPYAGERQVRFVREADRWRVLDVE